MRDSTAKTLTNWAMIDEWRSRRRAALANVPQKVPFVYTWFHSSTGKRGIGTIWVRSYAKLVEWLAKWNHVGATSGWYYSIFDTNG